MVGININCKEKDYVELILQRKKTIETRNTKSLDAYIGKRVGIIKTGKGKARLVGYMTISGKCKYTSYLQFRMDKMHHYVDSGSKYDFKNIKYGYILTDVERCEPVEVTTKGIVSRKI